MRNLLYDIRDAVLTMLIGFPLFWMVCAIAALGIYIRQQIQPSWGQW